MATLLPIRNLGAVGVVSDTSPYDLPLNAFSKAVNVVFDEQRAQRAPVFKPLYGAFRSPKTFAEMTTGADLTTATFENAVGGVAAPQRFIGSYSTAKAESVLVADVDGTVREYLNGNLAIVSPFSSTPVTNTRP